MSDGAATGFWRGAYADHGAAVLAFLASRMRRREDAEDLLQETFVRAIRAGEKLRDPGSVRSYLFSIAHRAMLNHHRRRREGLFSEQDERFAEGLCERADPRPDHPDAPVAERQLAACLAAELVALPDALRRAFEMAVVQALPYQEIANRTGWSLSAVKVNVYRARRRLVEKLARVVPELGRVS